MRVRYMEKARAEKTGLINRPCFHVSGSIKGMKKQFYGENALLVRCGNYIYDCTTNPDLYYMAH